MTRIPSKIVLALAKPIAWIAVLCVLAGCGGEADRRGPSRDSQRGEQARRSGCQALPSEGGGLDWLPANLKLPKETRRLRDLEPSSKEKAGLVALPLTLSRFTSFVEKDLRSQGWTVTGGDAEPGEVDRAIRQGRDVLRFRARNTFCNREWSAVEIRYFQTGPSCPGTTNPCDYAFEGFLDGISKTDTNVAKAGEELVIRWRLKDPAGRPFTELSAMVAAQMQEPTKGASVSLRFTEGLSITDGAYRLSVFSVPGWAGTTKIFTLFLDDGTAHQARFEFR